MKFKLLPNKLRKQTNNILNKNERLSTNIVNPTPTSIFDRSHRHLTTFNSGKLIPIYCDEALPGDIHNIDCTTLIRMSTPSAATMENPIYDIAFYFVPNRIVWESFKYFMGENKSAGFQKEYTKIPTVTYDSENFIYSENDLAAYLGFPINKNMHNINIPINSLYFKAYGKIWNDYYRDENLQSEIDITNNNNNDDNILVSAYETAWYQKSIQIGKGLAPVSRLPDYFSTALPFPQKGDAVSIDTLPLQNLIVNIPQINVKSQIGNYSSVDVSKLELYESSGSPLHPSGQSGADRYGYAIMTTQVPSTGNNGDIVINTANPRYSIPNNNNVSSNNRVVYTNLKSDEATATISTTNDFIYTVNDLRLSLAIQHMRELDARGGTRYVEILLNHFGIQASNERLDRAEYIGGFRDNINISNVVQSSSTVENNPLGVLGGVSVSSGTTPRKISYACKEHGIIMGFIIVRPQINYSQGLDKKFTRVEKLDYYDPLLANIGEQPIHKYELYLDDNANTDANTNNVIFGYNEAWADYRYSNNKLSGYMSVNSELSLSTLYAYTERYDNAPVLSESWMISSSEIIGDTLYLDTTRKSEYIHQFLGDFYFNVQNERKMPVYSIPGLRKI